MRIAFFGSSRFSCLVLTALCQSKHEIACIVTQPDQPAGRRMEPRPTVVCGQAQSLGAPLLKPERLRGQDFLRELQSHEPDALLVASFGKIIPAPLLDLTLWPLNVHPSMLPKLRGPSPVRSALLDGLNETGCCIMRMTPRLDDGDILLMRRLAIDEDWNYEELEGVLGRLGGLMANEAFNLIESGKAAFRKQEHSEASYTRMYTKDDSRLDWSRSARELANQVRAWDPDIGAWCQLADGRRVKIWRASVEEPSVELARDPAPRPGAVLALAKKAIWLTAGSGVLRIHELQPENRPRMDIASYLAGAKLAPGDSFAS